MTESSKNPFQFRLIWLFALTALTAFVCSVQFAFPPYASALIMVIITTAAASCCLMGLVFSRKLARAFFLGTAFPMGLLMLYVMFGRHSLINLLDRPYRFYDIYDNDARTISAILLVGLLISISIGALCRWLAGWLQREKR